MANDKEIIERLSQGTEAWNTWRTGNQPEVSLFQPNLKFVKLPGADLSGVQTHYALLQEANLAYANLAGAGLGDAYLAYADLTGANLRDSYLFRANFRGAKLAGADFTNALVGATDFLNVDLSQTLGLDSCRFTNPSAVDYQTLFKSGPLPLAFLRGCGLLLLISRDSMTSEWVATEIAKARKKETTSNRRVLFPISLVPYKEIESWELFDADHGKDSAREIREYFIPDFSQWKHHAAYAKAFDQLLRALKTADPQPSASVQRRH